VKSKSEFVVNKQLAAKVKEFEAQAFAKLTTPDRDSSPMLAEDMYDAAYRVKKDLESLYWQAEGLKRKMDEVMNRCRRAEFSENFDGKFYLGVNSLGEVQGRGTELDIQCALVSRAIEDLNTALHRHEKKAEVTK
jgi:hypothetical protein